MFNKTSALLVSAAVAVGMLASAASAQYDETRIRQDGQNTQVIGTSGCNMFFTITGYSSDYIYTPFYCGPLGNAPFVYQTVNNSGGQTSYRFCITAQRSWDQSIIELWRGACFIDGDRVRVN